MEEPHTTSAPKKLDIGSDFLEIFMKAYSKELKLSVVQRCLSEVES